MIEIISPSILQYINYSMSLFSSLINNISANFSYLHQDYTDIKISFSFIFNFSIGLLISITIIIIFYLIGLKIKQIFFRQNNGTVGIVIEIALGYIFLASGILILGMFGVLYRLVLYLYFVLLFIVAIYPITTLKKRIGVINVIRNKYLKQFINNKLINIAILGFILIGFLRLIPPEVGVDAIWYHTDYPRLYLSSHSMMNIDPIGKYYPAVTPTLSDMLYVITESVSVKDSSRFIHFSFYILSVLIYLIIFKKRYPFAPFAAFLFVTSPVIIRHTSTAYAEFEWIFCWLLAVFLITSKRGHSVNDIVLPAILIGGTLATKLWMLPFYGVFTIYLAVLNINENKLRLLKLLAVFTIISFSIPLLWYLRAFMLTGNPLFPAFWTYPNGEPNNPVHFGFDLANIKDRITSLANVSPFSVIGFVALLISSSKLKNFKFGIKPFIIFAIILTIAQILIGYNFHRFVIPFYSIIAIFLAFGIMKFVSFNKYFKYCFYLFVICFFLYYFINTLFTLPYGLGIANQNRYLSRILSRDNSSYYDYNNQFSKLITDKDTVATYGLWGFYYANFSYVYTEDIFRKADRSLKILRQKGATKLLILGGDIQWLCKMEKLKDCNRQSLRLLTFYNFPTTSSSQYLYELNYYEK